MGIFEYTARTAFVLWLCLGTQIHAAQEHGAYWHHAAEHAADAEHAAEGHDHDSPTGVLVEFAGVRILPHEHHHHEHERPHGHELDAVPVSSKYRTPYVAVVAILPVIALQEVCQAEANPVDADWYPPPILYLSQDTAPRAPPLA